MALEVKKDRRSKLKKLGGLTSDQLKIMAVHLQDAGKDAMKPSILRELKELDIKKQRAAYERRTNRVDVGDR